MAIYTIREEGNDFATVEAADPETALATAENEYVNGGSYDTSNGTIWVTWHAIDESGECVASRTIRIDPRAPKCCGGEHDWRSPHAIVGGLKENPGVHGHGGGVIITEVCMHCGCERVTDTWAQDRATGRQGLESVAYEARKYADEIGA